MPSPGCAATACSSFATSAAVLVLDENGDRPVRARSAERWEEEAGVEASPAEPPSVRMPANSEPATRARITNTRMVSFGIVSRVVRAVVWFGSSAGTRDEGRGRDGCRAPGPLSSYFCSPLVFAKPLFGSAM